MFIVGSSNKSYSRLTQRGWEISKIPEKQNNREEKSMIPQFLRKSVDSVVCEERQKKPKRRMGKNNNRMSWSLKNLCSSFFLLFSRCIFCLFLKKGTCRSSIKTSLCMDVKLKFPKSCSNEGRKLRCKSYPFFTACQAWLDGSLNSLDADALSSICGYFLSVEMKKICFVRNTENVLFSGLYRPWTYVNCFSIVSGWISKLQENLSEIQVLCV